MSPELHESSWGSPGWCIQRRVCKVLTIANVWVCNFKEKQQSSYSPSDGSILGWMRWPAGVQLVFGRGERGGRLVAWQPIPLSSYLSSYSSSSSSLLLSFTFSFFALRCASSCAGPGGPTERNTCKERRRNDVRDICLKSEIGIYTIKCSNWDTAERILNLKII